MQLQRQTRIEFGFSVQFTSKGMAISPEMQMMARNALDELAVHFFGGATFYAVNSVWQSVAPATIHSQRGVKMIVTVPGEPSVNLATRRLDIATVVQKIKDLLSQEAVCVVVSEVHSCML